MKRKQKINFNEQIIVVLIIFLVGLINEGCRKPNEPEKIEEKDITGGYTIVNKFATSGYAQDLIKKDTLLYIAQGEGGLAIVSVADPKNPKLISVTVENVRGYSTKVAMKDTVVYIAAGTYGVTVVNVANPAKPKVTASNLSMKPAKNVYVFNNYLFVPISEQGVKIAEISFPTQPDIRGGTFAPGYVQCAVINSDSTYLTLACGEMGFSLFDISDFQQGYGTYKLINWCDVPGYAESVVLCEEKKLAYMACGTAGLYIIDYSDTAKVKIAGFYDSEGYAKEIMYKNNKVYMTTEKSGLQIFDVSNPASPSLVGRINSSFALGLEMDNNYIYMTDEIEGLIIIKIP